MPKPNLIKKRGNVYHTPIDTPAETPRRFREVKSAIMPADSQENVDLWFDIFMEMGRETAEKQRRQHRNRQRKGA